MNDFPVATPQVIPPLDALFRPAVLVNRAFRAAALATGRAVPLGIAIEQADGSVFHARTAKELEADLIIISTHGHIPV